MSEKRWATADECARHLGLFNKNGTPNRRRFLERVAPRQDFPACNPVTRTWWLPDVQEWAEDQARLSRAA